MQVLLQVLGNVLNIWSSFLTQNWILHVYLESTDSDKNKLYSRLSLNYKILMTHVESDIIRGARPKFPWRHVAGLTARKKIVKNQRIYGNINDHTNIEDKFRDLHDQKEPKN